MLLQNKIYFGKKICSIMNRCFRSADFKAPAFSRCATRLSRSSQRVQASVYPVKSGQRSKQCDNNKYTWKTDFGDFDISYRAHESGREESILFVHGFGASIGHYRKIIDKFPEYNVYAIDLLGFGESSKPIVPYNMKIFRDQIRHFIAENIDTDKVHIVGNSIGSLAALMAAADSSSVKSLVLLNCAGGLNNKAIQEDWRVKLAMPLFLLIDLLLKNQQIGTWLFDKVRDRENLRKILTPIYPKNPSAVDDELIEMLHGPSNHPNAKDVFVEIITTNSAGPSPLQIIHDISCPILLLWGTADNLTPSDGPVGKFFQNIHEVRGDDSKFINLEGIGHCPMDEAPEEVVREMELWLTKLRLQT